MTSRLIDGRPMPALVAGHPALELCNTLGGWDTDNPHEYLSDFTALAIWAREIGVLTSAESADLRNEAKPTAQHRRVLRQVLDLREQLYRAVTARSASALGSVHGYVQRAVARSSYQANDHVVALDGGAGPTAIVDRLALHAHRLLEQHGLEPVTRCAAPDCGWLFLDAAHRRRWCVMAVCGNRAKARRYADRRRGQPPG